MQGRRQGEQSKPQAILVLPAVLQTLQYVDANPVRAKMAKTPEQSKYTSGRRRINRVRSRLIAFKARLTKADEDFEYSENAIPINFNEYLELLEGTGPRRSADKPGQENADRLTMLHRQLCLGWGSHQSNGSTPKHHM